MADIQAVTLVEEMGDTYTDSDHIVDAAGNHFVAFGEQQPGSNNTWVAVRKYAPSGAIVGEWAVHPTDNQKIDETTLAHSGNDLYVLIDTHEIKSDKPRIIRIESAVIPGVYVHTAGQELEEGGAGAFQPTGEPQEGGVTVEEVQAIVTQAVHDIKGQDNITLRVVIDNIESKTGLAIDQKKVVTETMFKNGLDGGSFILYDQLVNTSYTGALGALNKKE